MDWGYVFTVALGAASAAAGFRWSRMRRLREDCRNFGHRWEPRTDGGLRCSHCEVRHG